MSPAAWRSAGSRPPARSTARASLSPRGRRWEVVDTDDRSRRKRNPKSPSSIANTNPASTSFVSHKTKAGWTLGAGIEARLWGNWTGKVEYLYMDFGRVSTVAESSTELDAARGYLQFARHGQHFPSRPQLQIQLGRGPLQASNDRRISCSHLPDSRTHNQQFAVMGSVTMRHIPTIRSLATYPVSSSAPKAMITAAAVTSMPRMTSVP